MPALHQTLCPQKTIRRPVISTTLYVSVTTETRFARAMSRQSYPIPTRETSKWKSCPTPPGQLFSDFALHHSCLRTTYPISPLGTLYDNSRVSTPHDLPYTQPSPMTDSRVGSPRPYRVALLGLGAARTMSHNTYPVNHSAHPNKYRVASLNHSRVGPLSCYRVALPMYYRVAPPNIGTSPEAFLGAAGGTL